MVGGQCGLDHFAIAEPDVARAALFGVDQQEAPSGVDHVVMIGIEMCFCLLQDGLPVGWRFSEEVDVGL